MAKKFDLSHPNYAHLGKFTAEEIIECGHATVEKIDLGLDPSEMKYFEKNGMDRDKDDGYGDDYNGAYPPNNKLLDYDA
jgi:hypothetical protein